MFRTIAMSVLMMTFILAGQVQAQETAIAESTAAATTFVQFETSMGDFVVQTLPDKAPNSVANFLQYVNDGFYDGTIFHRVIGSFVLQGGGFTADFVKKPTREPVTNEADNMESNVFGTLAMARTADPHSATSQFYVNVADNVALDHSGKSNSRAWGYTVFAKVVSGFEVIEAMRGVATGAGGPFPRDVPQTAIVINRAATISAPPAAAPADSAPAVEAAASGENGQ